MTQSMRDFDDRLRRIDRNRRYAPGRFGGLLPARPPRGPRRLSRLRPALRGLAYLVVAFFLFKAAAFAILGEAEFTRRGAVLAGGTGWEQVVARMMQADGLTRGIGTALAPYLSPR